jgi:hypothetical protein
MEKFDTVFSHHHQQPPAEGPRFGQQCGIPFQFQ